MTMARSSSYKFLGPDGQDAIIPGLDGHPGAVQGRGRPGAGIFHINNGNAFHLIGGQGHLSADAMLKFINAPAGIGKPGGFNVTAVESAVFEYQFQGFPVRTLMLLSRNFPNLVMPTPRI